MKIIPSIDFRKLPEKPPAPKSITIGNFDGVHLGHQSLLYQALTHAEQHQIESLALTFSPRPESFFRKIEDEKLLFTEEQKIRSFTELGMDHAIIQKFDAVFCQMSPQDFYDKFLGKNINAQAICVGHDFRFGKDRLGNTTWLKKEGDKSSKQIYQCDAISYQEHPISSTRIRQTLINKDMESVTAMLGRPYLLEGCIDQGDQIGRKIGIPTLNLENHKQLVPGYGVYAGFVWLQDQSKQELPSIHKLPHGIIPAIINCGIRPTFKNKGSSLRVEAHLLAGDHSKQNHYDLKAGFYFTHFIRDELKFDSPSLLSEQIKKDIKKARKFLEIT
ncbi:MAG: riboflavin biosynthesis protein RibF [Oligoflexales bacterium]